MSYTNSPLVAYTRLSPNNSGQKKHSIDRITPHMVAGQCTAEELGGYFADADAKVSANYGIDRDGRIGLYVDESCRSWCSSNAENDDRAITIECASDKTDPFALRPAVFDTLINLCADICRRYGKTKLLWFGLGGKTKALNYAPAQDEMVLTIHQWFIDTACPGRWLLNHMEELAVTVTSILGGTLEEAHPATANDEPIPASPQGNGEGHSPDESEDAPPNGFYQPTGMQAADLRGMSNSTVIKTVASLFTADQRTSGILASVSLAQFLLESSYGQSKLFQAANNGFGMKDALSGNTWPGSVWDGESRYTMKTEEQRPDGSTYTITANFRKYPCIEDSIADHSAYLLGAISDNGITLRYLGLKGCTDYKKAARIIQWGGYATGIEYSEWLIKIIEMWNLTQYDIPGIASPVDGLVDESQENPPGEESEANRNTRIVEPLRTIRYALDQLIDLFQS